MRFYCGNNICPKKENKLEELEEYNLFITGVGEFGLVDLGYLPSDKYAACVGYFLTFFNSKTACSPYDEKNDDYVCNYSENIQIGYYGSTTTSKDKGDCGLKAIHNVIMLSPPLDLIEDVVNIGILRSYGPLIERLKNKGYTAGFSLAGIPNDYRYFLANNNFTLSAIRYQVEKLYENTGKKVVIIGHSFGTITVYNSLVFKKNRDILDKIKKFVAVGPTFAGSSYLLEMFFKSGNRYSRTIDMGDGEITVGFDDFGFGFVINKLPTAFELRPLPILGNLFTKPGYEIFADAIKERYFLEKKCGHNKCDDYLINKYSSKFNALFKDYFPLLTDEDCKFEPELKETSSRFNRKCLMDMRNIFDCPIIIEETRDKNGKLPSDFDSYCGRDDQNLFYQKSCDKSKKQCLDQVYSKHVEYPFRESDEKLKYFKDRWAENYTQEFGDYDPSFVYSEKEYKEAPQKQIEYYEKISITKELPAPLVDTDIVYSTYEPTVAAFIFDKNDWHKNFNKLEKGGDGVVPNWSAIMPGLKWAYDTKKFHLKNKIRLVEFCSRLGKNSKYTYNPSDENQKFVAISCDCINENNEYKGGDCGHAAMIADPKFYEYFYSVIQDPKQEISYNQIAAVTSYNPNLNYEEKCNEDYLNLLEISKEKSNS